MKLIDLLVKELPKRGGWPNGATFAVQDRDAIVKFNISGHPSHNDKNGMWFSAFGFMLETVPLDELSSDFGVKKIRESEYEKALSESRTKPTGRMIPVITDNNDVRDSFEFISINHTELRGRRVYVGDKTDGSAYHCHDVYWIPEMYEKKSDKEVVEDAIKEDTKNILDSSAKLVVAKLVEKAISQVEEAGCKLIGGGSASDNVDDVDFVNHPPHYQSNNGVECIDAIRAALGKEGFIAHCRGTAIKYLYRAPNKDAQLQDLKKAAWYVQKAIEEMEKK